MLAELNELSDWAASVQWRDIPENVRERFRTIVLDTVGVTALGGSFLGRQSRPYGAAGNARSRNSSGNGVFLFGKDNEAPLLDAVAWNGKASVCLELDEGNKYAKGHPAAHVFPAAIGLADSLGVDGENFMTAFIVGHEVASRFGRATRLRAGIHPHGNWGAAGAAAAAGRLMSFDRKRMAAAIDIGAGLAVASTWPAAINGSGARDLWISMANVAGILAAEAAESGAESPVGAASFVLGEAIGEFSPTALSQSLGESYSLVSDYLKRHPSCGYTHPPVDAMLQLLTEKPDLQPHSVVRIVVETHSPAARLSEREPKNVLAARFSIPWSVAVALLFRRCPIDASDPHGADAGMIGRIAALTEVHATDHFDRLLPDQRAARVTVATADGARYTHSVTNPVGDVDNQPLTHQDVIAKLSGLSSKSDFGEAMDRALQSLETQENISRAIRALPTP